VRLSTIVPVAGLSQNIGPVATQGRPRVPTRDASRTLTQNVAIDERRGEPNDGSRNPQSVWF
jgi:hypothetical protein